MPAQFQAAVYEVQLGADKIGTLDSHTLTRQASTADTLLQSLSDMGNARILYRIDQPVNVLSDQIQVGTNEPTAAMRTIRTGRAVTTATGQKESLVVNLSAPAPSKETERKSPEVKVSLQLSTPASSDVQSPIGFRMSAIRKLSFEHTEPLELGRPVVLLSISASSDADQKSPRLHVIRYLFNPPARKE